MNRIKVPKFFHDILGEETQPIALGLILSVTALVMGYLTMSEGNIFISAGLFKGLLGFILLADIIAGTVANFSAGTNDFYARRSKNRWAFIAVHIQPLLIAWLLGFSVTHAALLWIFVILSAVIVNALMGKAHQRIVAGALMSLGVFIALNLYGAESMSMQVMAVFYVIKVVFSFGVDHERGVRDDS